MTRVLSADVVWLPDGVLITVGQRLHVMVIGRAVTVFTDDDAEPAAPEQLEPEQLEPAPVELAEPARLAEPDDLALRVKNGKALLVVCSSCGSSVGEFCVSSSGKRSPTFHAPRLAASKPLRMASGVQ